MAKVNMGRYKPRRSRISRAPKIRRVSVNRRMK